MIVSGALVRSLPLLLVVLLSACQKPLGGGRDHKAIPPVTADSSHREQFTLVPGVILTADEIHYQGQRRTAGEARGNVVIQVLPEARYRWGLFGATAGVVSFDRKTRVLRLTDFPAVQRSQMRTLATEAYTTMEIDWNAQVANLQIVGPSRAEFSVR